MTLIGSVLISQGDELTLWEDILVQRRENLEAMGGEALLEQLEERQMDVLRSILAVRTDSGRR